MQYTDLSHLTPAEAHNKVSYLALKLYMDQYNVNFFIKSPLPEQYLKNELLAYWEGRISEIHGWEDPLGQAVKKILESVGDMLDSLWEDTISPALGNLISPISDVLDTVKKNVEGFPDFVDFVKDFVDGFSDAVSAVVVDAVSTVQTWIDDAVSGIPDLMSPYFTTVQDLITASWEGITESVSGTLEIITKGFEALPQSIAAGFQNAISYLGDVLGAFWTNTLVPFGEEIKDAFWQALNAVGDMMAGLITTMINMAKSYAPISPTNAEDFAVNVSKIVLTTGIGLGGAFLLGELLHPLKQIGLGHVAAMIYRATNYDQFTGAVVGALVDATLRKPLRYTFNQIFRPWLPSLNDILSFRKRGLIDDKKLRELLAYQGLADEWHPYFVELSKSIPGVSDLVTFVVRECFPLEDLPPAPKEFVESLKMWNMDEKWARAYWFSHWQLPAYDQLVEAYFRGVISLEELRKFIIWHDYSPDPRPGISKSDVDIMNELIYRMPDKLDARWMLRWGVVNKDEYKKLRAMDGLHPDWLEKVAEAEFLNNLTDERSAVKTAIASLYVAGYYSEDVIKSVLKDMKFIDEEIDLLLKTNEYKRMKEELDDMVTAYVTAFRYGKITLDELKANLANLGMQDWRIARIIETELARAKAEVAEKREEEARAYGYHIAMNRFEDGISSEEDLENELRMLGYSEAQIERYKIAAMLERDRKYAMEVLSTAKYAWQKGYIGDDTFIETLQNFGFEEWKIMLELNLMKLRRGLMPTKEGEAS